MKETGNQAFELLTALSMTVGRGRPARAVADIAALTPADRVVDIGCGPGTAVREAARRCAAATGVDPSPLMLRLARWISSVRRSANVGWLAGRAEKLPVPDGEATVAWAVSSVHHWDDRAAGLRAAGRALAPAGRLVIAERLVQPGARGHGAHGLTSDQAGDLAREIAANGFREVRTGTQRVGHRQFVVVEGVKG